MTTPDELVSEMLKSYEVEPRAQRIGRRYLPSRDEIAQIVSLLLQIFYPGYFGRQDLTHETVGIHVGGLLLALKDKLERQTEMCLCYAAEAELPTASRGSIDRPPDARTITATLLGKLPEIRATLVGDVQAAYDGDPAATSLDEVILAYPGLLAVTVYRVAHELYEMGVPLMPRIMAEWAHSQTGADIHPGAIIGDRFFIDHSTGVVVGETTRIGKLVKLYQGVTLGALSHPRDEHGRVIRNTKRHPTVEDNVTIYANATVLGGETTIRAGSVVGGSVFLTESVPEGSRVAMKPPELKVAPYGGTE